MLWGDEEHDVGPNLEQYQLGKEKEHKSLEVAGNKGYDSKNLQPNQESFDEVGTLRAKKSTKAVMTPKRIPTHSLKWNL